MLGGRVKKNIDTIRLFLRAKGHLAAIHQAAHVMRRQLK